MRSGQHSTAAAANRCCAEVSELTTVPYPLAQDEPPSTAMLDPGRDRGHFGIGRNPHAAIGQVEHVDERAQPLNSASWAMNPDGSTSIAGLALCMGRVLNWDEQAVTARVSRHSESIPAERCLAVPLTRLADPTTSQPNTVRTLNKTIAAQLQRM